MKCPFCDGDCEPVYLRSVGARSIDAKRCTQCGGFWLTSPLSEQLNPTSIAQYESPAPNYSMRSSDLVCPNDNTLLVPSDHDPSPHAGKFWHCPDCAGEFFPRGQLSLYNQHQSDNAPTPSPTIASAVGMASRAQAGVGAVALLGLAVLVMASFGKVNYQAATDTVLPSTGPSLITLALLAVTYLAGTTLAVLGRRLSMILLGWGVIAACLIGFAVIIFGP